MMPPRFGVPVAAARGVPVAAGRTATAAVATAVAVPGASGVARPAAVGDSVALLFVLLQPVAVAARANPPATNTCLRRSPRLVATCGITSLDLHWLHSTWPRAA